MSLRRLFNKILGLRQSDRFNIQADGVLNLNDMRTQQFNKPFIFPGLVVNLSQEQINYQFKFGTEEFVKGYTYTLPAEFNYTYC